MFIAVGTPAKKMAVPICSYVLTVAKEIGEKLEQAPIVVADKSTVPVGTADKVRAEITHGDLERRGIEISFDVVSNPEVPQGGCGGCRFHEP